MESAYLLGLLIILVAVVIGLQYLLSKQVRDCKTTAARNAQDIKAMQECLNNYENKMSNEMPQNMGMPQKMGMGMPQNIDFGNLQNIVNSQAGSGPSLNEILQSSLSQNLDEESEEDESEEDEESEEEEDSEEDESEEEDDAENDEQELIVEEDAESNLNGEDHVEEDAALEEEQEVDNEASVEELENQLEESVDDNEAVEEEVDEDDDLEEDETTKTVKLSSTKLTSKRPKARDVEEGTVWESENGKFKSTRDSMGRARWRKVKS